MQVKTVDATEADKISARVLFDSLFALREVYWGDSYVSILDAFARNGQLTVSSCVNRRQSTVEAWELGEEHEAALQALGCSIVHIGCSYARLKVTVEQGSRYNLLVVDTPQGLHTSADKEVRTEHFSFLDEAVAVLADTSVVVLYVNTDPYDASKEGEHGYDQYAEYNYTRWMWNRTTYYGSPRITPERAVEVYRRRLLALGYHLSMPLMVPCLSDVPTRAPYAFRLAFKLQRSSAQSIAVAGA